MIVFARDSNHKNKAVPADPGCSGVPGFPYTHCGRSNKVVLKLNPLSSEITTTKIETFCRNLDGWQSATHIS